MVTAVDMGRALVAAVALERAVELAVSRRNERRLRAAGAVEVGRGHYPAMVAFHAALLAACALEPALWPSRWPAAAAAAAAIGVALAQGLRWWVVWTLSGRWTTRVLVLPGAAPVRSGPYRWLRHPNYLAVIVEVAALPLACGAWRTALVATVLNAGILAVRIRAEEGALGDVYRDAFAGVPRFVPSPNTNPNLNPAPLPATRLPAPDSPGPGLHPGGWERGPGNREAGVAAGRSGPGSGAGPERP